MVSEDLFRQLEKLIPAGERSDFINTAIQEQMALYGRKKAFAYFATLNHEKKKRWNDAHIVTFLKNERKKGLL